MPYAVAQDGVKLHYELHDYTDPWKKAPVLILQHGLARSARFWYNMVPYLARFYKVICPDLRGCGASSSDFDLKAGLTISNYISDFMSIADALEVDDLHFAGESIGGTLGFVFAAEHPGRVRTLTTFGSPLVVADWLQKSLALTYPTWIEALQKMGSEAWSKAIAPAPAFPHNIDPGLFEWYTDEMGKSKVEVLIAMAELVPGVDAEPFLGRIQCPVLGVYPNESPAAPDQLETMKREIPNFQLLRMGTRFQVAQALAPATCASHLLHFVSTHDGTACREL